MMPGVLYIVSTPIGNLEDITYRAVRVLGEVSLIACEDTRQTRKLLERYGVRTSVVSYHEHNEQARATELVERLLSGASVALVSDAGTPLVSDPGYRIVAAAIAAGVRVEPIPGASALLSALAASGLPTDTFQFAGFLPAKVSARRKMLESFKTFPATLVFYEAPHRILETLDDVEEILGARPVVVARELTKLHEEFLRGSAREIRDRLAARPTVKGEITLLIGRGEEVVAQDDAEPAEQVARLVAGGMARMAAIKTVARQRGLGKREVYRLVEGDGVSR
jgi:16S rRNA (cytidine1402-2'-O)-methyltransferase